MLELEKLDLLFPQAMAGKRNPLNSQDHVVIFIVRLLLRRIPCTPPFLRDEASAESTTGEDEPCTTLGGFFNTMALVYAGRSCGQHTSVRSAILSHRLQTSTRKRRREET